MLLNNHQYKEILRNQYNSFAHENNHPRQDDIKQSLEAFSNEFNLRLSQEMDSMMSMMHSQINRAISNAISERVIPEIQNIASSMSSSGNKDTEASVSPNSQENREWSSGFKSESAKGDSRSVCDLRDTTGRSHYRCRFETLKNFQKQNADDESKAHRIESRKN